MFTSDNTSAMHPEVLKTYFGALASSEVHKPYGQDILTEKLQGVVSDVLGRKSYVFPVTSGTSGNILSLRTLAAGMPGEVLCSDVCHMFTHEAMASELMAGVRMKPVGQDVINGLAINRYLDGKSPVDTFHGPRTLGVVISQCDENGRAYSTFEIKEIARAAKEKGWFVFVDGARFANALSSEQEAIQQCKDIDALCIGGSKNGCETEAVVFFDKQHADTYRYFAKSMGHLPSKMFAKSAQLLAYFEDGLWLKNAAHANEMAERLRDCLDIKTEVGDTNAVFCALSPDTVQILNDNGYYPYEWEPGRYRFMCSWDTKHEHVLNAASIVARNEPFFQNLSERADVALGGETEMDVYDTLGGVYYAA
jgi:threonine aldolase